MFIISLSIEREYKKEKERRIHIYNFRILHRTCIWYSNYYKVYYGEIIGPSAKNRVSPKI